LGSPKAELTVDGERLADRGARLLTEVCDVVIEVGPGFSSLPAVREEPEGSGPLAALVAGADALAAHGAARRVLVLAVDLPFVTRALLEYLRDQATDGTVVPRVDGVPQPLCARYSSDAVAVAETLLGDGARAMKTLLGTTPVTWVDEAEWSRVATPDALADVDTPDDARRTGLQPPG
jgi:molybdopterin-guanine dinucleotide biosynthesis protein A